MEPSKIDRPQFPEGYGIPTDAEGIIPWATIDTRLKGELHFWMATVRPNGRPHVVPRWGAWMDGKLFYDGAPTTVHATNLRANPHCVLSVGSGVEAIIVEGESVPSKPLTIKAAAPLRLEITHKYGELGYIPEEGSWSDPEAGGLHVFTPAKALAWFSFPSDVSRYRF